MKYRWISEGRFYRYRGIRGIKPYLDSVCRVIRVPRGGCRAPGNVLVAFPDGSRVIVPMGTLKEV